jgi:hypothetical protein
LQAATFSRVLVKLFLHTRGGFKILRDALQQHEGSVNNLGRTTAWD